MGSILFLLIVIILVLWILASCIRIVPQAYAIVLERLGAYQATWGTGVHFKLPFVERVARKVNLKEQVVDGLPDAAVAGSNELLTQHHKGKACRKAADQRYCHPFR